MEAIDLPLRQSAIYGGTAARPAVCRQQIYVYHYRNGRKEVAPACESCKNLSIQTQGCLIPLGPACPEHSEKSCWNMDILEEEIQEMKVRVGYRRVLTHDCDLVHSPETSVAQTGVKTEGCVSLMAYLVYEISDHFWRIEDESVRCFLLPGQNGPCWWTAGSLGEICSLSLRS